MNIVIFNHHLSTWAGSETICIELIEELRSMDHQVSVICQFASLPFVQNATGDWTTLEKELFQNGKGQIDVILVFHQGLSTLTEAEFHELFSKEKRPFIAYFHLSPYEELELPGPFVERYLADAVYANSGETREELRRHGFENVELFQNPAPAKFSSAPSTNTSLTTLLSISNHIPAELSQALELLAAKGIKVHRIGLPEGNRRVLPEDIAGSDAVLTIGKSVQFALRARRPVFCYDRFQGPGWLTPWTEEEEFFNFSGRSSMKTLSPEEIANNIENGFPGAHQWVQENNTSALKRFHIEDFLSRLLQRVRKTEKIRKWPDWTKDSKWRSEFRTERSLYRLVDRGYPLARKFQFSRSKQKLPKEGSFKEYLEKTILRTPEEHEPMVVAVFSINHDTHLVEQLMKNIGPSIHGCVSFDERKIPGALTNTSNVKAELYKAAEEMGADWIFAVNPDERFEDDLVEKVPYLTSAMGPVVWTMDCREMFNEKEYRCDGVWSIRPRERLFPCYPGMEPETNDLYGKWTRNAQDLPVVSSGVDFYRLRIGTKERRALRRRLCDHLDADQSVENIGYEYLDDKRGIRLRTVPVSRNFSPPYTEDSGVWTLDVEKLNEDVLHDDSELQTLKRIVRSRKMQGFENSMHVARDLADENPGDVELELLAADTALRANSPETAIEICKRLVEHQPQSIFAFRLLATGYLAVNDTLKAKSTIDQIDAIGPNLDLARDLKSQLDQLRNSSHFSSTSATWRRWLRSGPSNEKSAMVYSGNIIPRARLSVIVLCTEKDQRVLGVVEALVSQSEPVEIVVVYSGGEHVREELSEYLDRIRIVTVTHTISSGTARNIGIDCSSSDYVSFLNADLIPTPCWSERILQEHDLGYSYVPSRVVPLEDAPDPVKSVWVWLYRDFLSTGNTTSYSEFGSSYARQLFGQYGYFPTGVKTREDIVLNARMNGNVEAQKDAVNGITFNLDTQVEAGMKSRARSRPLHIETDNLMEARQRTKNDVRSAELAVSTLKNRNFRLPDTIGEELEKFARWEEEQSARSVNQAVKAKALWARAKEVLGDDPDEACRIMDEALSYWPHSAEMDLFSATCALRSTLPSRQDKAVSLAIRAFAKDPDLYEAISFALKELVEQRAMKKALDTLHWATTLNPNSVELLMLGRLLSGPRFLHVRAIYFQRAFFLAPWAPGPNNHLVAYYRQAGENKTSDARKSFFAKVLT